MTIYFDILDDNENYQTDKYIRTTGNECAAFQVSNTKKDQKLVITRIRYIDGNPKEDPILSLDLQTGRVAIFNIAPEDLDAMNAALEKAAEKITEVESPYIGVFNDK